MSAILPARADVVVIGGGIAGLSALYHLAREGITNTVLVERRQLACGTTWHSVGSVGQVRGSRMLTLLSSCTADLLPEIERETGMATGYKRYGSIGLALNAERLEEFKRTVALAKAWGHEAELLTPGEIKERYPAVRTDDVLGGLYLPGDGRTNPVDTVQALARACRNRGARIFEETKVEEIVVADSTVRGVRTSRGDVEAEKVLLCAGMWSREIAEHIGVHIPLLAAEHFYAVTEPIPGLPRDTPMVRVPDERTYYKEDAGKLLFGCLEEKAKPWGVQGIPEGFCFDSLPEDLEHFAPILEAAMIRMPLLRDAGIKLFFNGPESFTPDGNFHLGEASEVRNLFVSCGFNTIGVMASGGIGRLAAKLIAHGYADWDTSSCDVKRAPRFQTNVRFLADRITEGLGKLYGLQCPNPSFTSGRGIRRRPLHDRLIAGNAVMEQVGGWERAAVFAPHGVRPEIIPSYGRPNWHDWCAAECRAATEASAVLDQTSLAKIAIVGRDALSAADILFSRAPTASQPAVRSLLLSERGTIDAIVQVVRLAPERILVLGPAGDEIRLGALIGARLPETARATIVDMTSAYAVLDLFGPAVGSGQAKAGVRPRPGPTGCATAIDIGQATGWRVSGAEHGVNVERLILAAEMAAHVHETLSDGAFTSIGAFALASLRLEAGLPGWGTEVDPTSTPDGSALSLLVDLSGLRDPIGRAAVAAQRAEGRFHPTLAQVVLEETSLMLHGGEPITQNGAVLGWMVSGAYGYRLGRAVGIAVLSVPLAGELDREIAVEIAGSSCAARLKPACTTTDG